MFDIVIPLGPNEYTMIHTQIAATKAYILGYRNIYIVTRQSNIQIEGCTIIDESIFPVTMASVQSILGKNERNGWYLQQLLKLYAGSVIPGILDRYLMIDSDVFFKKPIRFEEDDICLYTTSIEYHTPYFEHMIRLHPSLTRKMNASGIVHHMMFETKYINGLFELVKQTHPSIDFWEAFLKNVDPQHILHSGASEYEMYFNYMLEHNPTRIRIRPLKWISSPTINNSENCDYLAVHWYMRFKS